MQAVGGLMLEGVPLNAIADQLGTPVWVTGAGTLRARYRRLRAALDEAGLDASVHYAVKANDHLAVLRVLSAEGAGADVVSGGELRRARAAGIAASRIVFSGVGKSAEELRLALEQEIGQINVESAEEMEMLAALAHDMGRRARIALRVNPDIDAGTHAKITTGRADNKFGIPYDDVASLYVRAAGMPGLEPVGLAVHIGSQIESSAPFRAAYQRVADLVRRLRGKGQAVSVVDCGGGLGVSYRDENEGSPRALAGAIRVTLGDLGVRLVVEPGRWLAAPAGVLLSSVLLVKHRPEAAPPFIVLDSAMNDLLRPSLYDSWHGLLPLSARLAASETVAAHVVGPVCESGDTFSHDRLLPPLRPGDRVAILDTGAYGAVMSSTYNARPLAAQALVDGARWTTIRPRQEISALWRDEIVPDWIE
jgi:diaminopimelate decarboxylase